MYHTILLVHVFVELREIHDCNQRNLLHQALKDKFPRGGAMGLLECNPDLAGRYEALARRFADNLGYVAPANVLWTFHFINGRHDL